MNKISFWDILDLINPKNNLIIENIGEKIGIVMYHHDNEEKLYDYAIEWGLLDNKSSNKINEDYVFNEGQIVRVFTKNTKPVDYLILEIKKHEDKIEIICGFGGTYRNFYRKDISDQTNDFYILGYADDNKYIQADLKYQKMLQRRGI